jgi:hypothetical protein
MIMRTKNDDYQDEVDNYNKHKARLRHCKRPKVVPPRMYELLQFPAYMQKITFMHATVAAYRPLTAGRPV